MQGNIMRATQENIQFVATELDHPEGMNFGIDGQLYAGGEDRLMQNQKSICR
jgi:hypothetical protein